MGQLSEIRDGPSIISESIYVKRQNNKNEQSKYHKDTMDYKWWTNKKKM